MIRLEGIIPALPTPFREDGELYPEKTVENISFLLEHDLSGFVVLGSTGELVLLSEKEKEEAFATARKAIPAGRLMIAGTGGQSTRETILLTRAAVRSGADAVLVLNPFYYKGLMKTDVLVEHYYRVADASAVPVIIYNMPGNSGIDMDAGTILEISGHPNIIGLKDSGSDLVKLSEVIGKAGKGFRVMTGSGGLLLQALATGASGGILALANIAPALCLGIYNAFGEGSMENARELQNKATPLNQAVTRLWGIPALKAAMDHLGMYGGPARRPLLPMDEMKRASLIALLENIL